MLISNVRAAVSEGVTLVQIREKSLASSQLFELARHVVDVVADKPVSVLVNDRWDIALASGAHGVHLRSDSMPARTVRAQVPDGFIIGVSVHSLAEREKFEGADFAMFGPVFSTPGKGQPAGLPALEEICAAVRPFPVIAVGGIGFENFKAVLAAGAAGFAAIRALDGSQRIESPHC
ncbi:MAG: thiamine phosphate synthase [Pyrinomonadaceae bacterium]